MVAKGVTVTITPQQRSCCQGRQVDGKSPDAPASDRQTGKWPSYSCRAKMTLEDFARIARPLSGAGSECGDGGIARDFNKSLDLVGVGYRAAVSG